MRFYLVVLVAILALAALTPLGHAYQAHADQSLNATYTGPKLSGSASKPLPPGDSMNLAFMLQPNNSSYLLSYSLNGLGSGSAFPFLNRVEAEQTFSPGEKRFDALLHFLNSEGFSVTYESPDRLMVGATAPASVVEKVFNTSFTVYSWDGVNYYRPSSAPSAPTQLANVTVAGLENYTAPTPQYLVLGALSHGVVKRVDVPHSVQVPPGFQFGATYYGPGTIESAYNATSMYRLGYKGQGQTVAVIEMYGDPELTQDLAKFDSQFNLPPANIHVIPIGAYEPQQGIPSGWDIETALDVEVAHSIAPLAKIDVLVASNPVTGLYEAIDYVVSNDLANVTSMSWGTPENLYAQTGFYSFGSYGYSYPDYYFALGSAEGISFFAASGDGAAYDGTPSSYGSASFPSSSPYVTSVGGTTLYSNDTYGLNLSQGSGYMAETAWSSSPQYFGEQVGSGGGPSTLFPKPWYQLSIPGSTYRETPDVSADANPYTGVLTVVEGVYYVVGGTSVATPLWGAATALLDQYLHTRIGLLNPTLYSIYAHPALYAKAFHEVSFGYNGAYYASKGYNMVTGLGSPNIGGLAQAIQSLSQRLTVTVSTGFTGQYPQYPYGSEVPVYADVYLPSGQQVSTGSFEGYVYSTSGLIETFPLNYVGGRWMGSFPVTPGDPPNSWEVVVNGTSAGLNGTGAAPIDVGLSVTIVQPVPYPYSAPIEPGQIQTVEVLAAGYNSTPLANGSFTAQFAGPGGASFSTALTPQGGGIFAGEFELPSGYPQGVYVMRVTGGYGAQTGYAYTYEYFGEILEAALYTPVVDALPSAAPGETLSLIAGAETPSFSGLFTSQITARFVGASGETYLTVNLTPAPATTQLGIDNLFGLQEANVTVPANMTPGFYTVEFTSTYASSGQPERGYYNTSVYISPDSVSYSILGLHDTVEGGTATVTAKITYVNGTPVTAGLFSATFLPTQDQFRSAVVAEYTGAPMVYNSQTGLWVASYQLPSVLGSSYYSASSASAFSGSWSVVVAGETVYGAPDQPYFSYFTVEPYTYLPIREISPVNLSTPLLSFTGSGYTLQGAALEDAVIYGMSMNLAGDYLSNVTVVDSSITVSGSVLSGVKFVRSNATVYGSTVEDASTGISAFNSSLSVTHSVFENLGYAVNPVNTAVSNVSDVFLNVVNISSFAPPVVKLLTPDVGITGGISFRVYSPNLIRISATLNGVPVSVSAKHVGGDEYAVTARLGKASSTGQAYDVRLVVNNGLSYTYSFFVFNQAQELAYEYVSLTLLAIVGVAVVILLIERRSQAGRTAGNPRHATTSSPGPEPAAEDSPATSQGPPEAAGSPGAGAAGEAQADQGSAGDAT